MKKIKIVHYLPNLVNGGIESMLLNYYEKLQQEFEFVIVIHEKPIDSCVKKFEKLGIKIYQIEHWIRNPKQNYKDLFKILKEEQPEIFHTHHNLNNFIPCFIAKQAGIKIRVSHCHRYFPKKTMKQKLYSLLTRWFSTDFAACGLGAAQFMTNKKWVEQGKVKIIYNAVDLEKFKYSKASRENIRKLHGWGPNDFVYGNIGRYAEQKNQLFLIDVYEKIASKSKNAKFVIIGGDGHLYSQILERVNTSKIKEKTVVLKDLENTNDYYSAMDVFLLPSLFEGFAVALIEAQAANLPCIVSNTVTKEFNSKNIIYIPIEDSNVWANEAMQVKIIDREIEISEQLKKLFDINYSYLVLRDYYFDLLRRRDK